MARIISRTACVNLQRIGKKTVTAMLTSESSFAKGVLKNLDDSQWDVMSFNPNNREVCIVLYSPSGNKFITVNLPYISWIP